MKELGLGVRGPHFSEVTRKNLGGLLRGIIGEGGRKVGEVREEMLGRELGQVRLGRVIDNKIGDLFKEEEK